MALSSSSRAMGWLAWVPLCAGAGLTPLEDEEGSTSRPPVAEAGICALCHSNAPRATAMRDADGQPIGAFDLWRSSMMASSARDPFWRASVAAEIAATPEREAEIAAKCLSCHTPMAHRVGLEDHETGSTLHVLACESPLGELARDGVSCTICHGITPAGLGTPDSFSAGFQLDGERLFGPHASPFAMPMRHHTGFTPTDGAQILRSALCATCHTLRTDALDAEGRDLGVSHLEQSPYLEWRNSDYRTADEPGGAGPAAASCQACHAPTTDAEGRTLATRIARNPAGRDWPPIRPRAPFGQHVFVGGNTVVPALLRDHAAELGVTAPPGAFDETLAATREQLSRAAALAIEDVDHDGERLTFTVHVENRTGHKLPTGHPSRRLWVRTLVRDAGGNVLFASGNADARGRIVDEAGLVLDFEQPGGPIPPHRTVIRRADEVPVYRAVMADEHGAPTHVLLRATGWYVDNRLLPRGWSGDFPDAESTAPVGTQADPDFSAGVDHVRYELAVPREPGVSIDVALLYQPIDARWAAELLRWELPEVEAFGRMLAATETVTEVVTETTWPAE